jgi:hypothetical protein
MPPRPRWARWRNWLVRGCAARPLLRPQASDIHLTPRNFAFRYRSAAHWIDVFRTWYGPLHKAFAALPPEDRIRLEQDLVAPIAGCNTSDDGTVVVPAEDVEVVIVRK